MRAVVALFILILLLVGCDEETGPIRTVARGEVAPLDDGSWVSGPWPWLADDEETEGLIEIAPETQIRLEHGLGRRPVEIHCYVGFSSDATWIMPSAGNACEIRLVEVDHVIIRNGSGGSFYYRFVLR